MGFFDKWFGRKDTPAKPTPEARFEALCKQARDDESVASQLHDDDIPLALEELKDLEHRFRYGRGALRVGLEALRRRIDDWTPELDDALGAACARATYDDVPKVAPLLTALPLERRFALLRKHMVQSVLYGGLDPRLWLEHCPTLPMLVRYAAGETHSSAFHKAVASIEHGSQLVEQALFESAQSMAEDGRFGTGRSARAVHNLLVEYFSTDVEESIALKLLPLFEEVFRQEFANEELARVFAQLPLGARESVAMQVEVAEHLPPFGDVVGPHAFAPTEKVAAMLLAHVFEGEGDRVLIASRALESFPLEVVEPVLRTHEASTIRAANWLEATRWFLEIGVSPACDQPVPPLLTLIQLGFRWGKEGGLGWCVRDLVVDGDTVIASTSAGVVAILSTQGVRVLTEPRQNDGLLPCRIAAVTDAEVAVWGWEGLSVYDKKTGKRWGLDLGHGNDEDHGTCHVSGPRLRVPDGTYVNLVEKDWDSEFANAEEQRFHLAAATDEGFMLARDNELHFWSPEGFGDPLKFADKIISIDGAVVMKDGSIAEFDTTPLAIRVDQGARDATVQRTGAWTAVVASYGKTSTVSVWVNDERTFHESYEGQCVVANGEPGIVIVPGGVLVLGAQTRRIEVPALRGSAAACTATKIFVGTETGQVLVLNRSASTH